jgi:hypothetical protein
MLIAVVKQSPVFGGAVTSFDKAAIMDMPGARSPEEIALSVIAEIQAVTSKRDGGLLSQKNAPINS